MMKYFIIPNKEIQLVITPNNKSKTCKITGIVFKKNPAKIRNALNEQSKQSERKFCNIFVSPFINIYLF